MNANDTNADTDGIGRPSAAAVLIAIVAVFAALMIVPAAGLAKSPVKFGSKLNPTVQPSNSYPGLEPQAPGPATFVQNEAYGRPNAGHIAPKNGRIKAIRVIAGGPGSFRPQIVEVKGDGDQAQAKVLRSGRLLTYAGQTEANYEDDRYTVEKFKVDIPVEKGQQLALRGDITSMIRCSSGGDNTLIFSPSLRKRTPYKTVSETDGCWILMEAVIR
ncbi:MAG: hypothetical protein R2725_04405 [Solirubrobacterales bacterium]